MTYRFPNLVQSVSKKGGPVADGSCTVRTKLSRLSKPYRDDHLYFANFWLAFQWVIWGKMRTDSRSFHKSSGHSWPEAPWNMRCIAIPLVASMRCIATTQVAYKNDKTIRCSLFVDRTKLESIQQNKHWVDAFENAICRLAYFLCRTQCVNIYINTLRWKQNMSGFQKEIRQYLESFVLKME